MSQGWVSAIRTTSAFPVTILVGRCRGRVGSRIVNTSLAHLLGELLSNLTIGLLEVGDGIRVTDLSLVSNLTAFFARLMASLRALGGELLLLIGRQGGILILPIVPVLNVLKLAFPGLEFGEIDGIGGRLRFGSLLDIVLIQRDAGIKVSPQDSIRVNSSLHVVKL